jgi:hypothetical protein
MGTDVRSMLESVLFLGSDGATPTAIENGNVLKVGALNAIDAAAGSYEREVRVGEVPAANSKLDEIVLVATPEVMYDERKRSMTEFYNEAGRICRGYHLHSGDMFSVTIEALDAAATPAIGNAVELQAGTKLKVAASATSGSTQIGTIDAINVVGRLTYYVIKVA